MVVLLAVAWVAAVGLGQGEAAGAVPADGKPAAEKPGAPAGLAEADRLSIERQVPMTQVANEIRNLVENGAGEGFAGLQAAGDVLQLWWKGTAVPASIQAVATKSPVKVEVKAAQYSKKELKSASTQLMKSDGIKNGGQVHAVKLPFDGSGLTAVVGPGDSKVLAARVGVPVQVVAEKMLDLEWGRCDDSAPWYGGNAIYNQSVAGNGSGCPGLPGRVYHCSTSFGVTFNGREYLLTAGHCGGPMEYFGNTNLSTTGAVGRAAAEHVGHDLMIVTADATGRIWDGGAAQQGYSKAIAGWVWSYGGQDLCHSGATTGTRCAHKVDSAYTTLCGTDIHGPAECYDDLISAKGGDPTAGGDSGGAWFAPADASWSKLVAVGSHTGSLSYIWGHWMVFQDFGTATRDFPGLTVITG